MTVDEYKEERKNLLHMHQQELELIDKKLDLLEAENAHLRLLVNQGMQDGIQMCIDAVDFWKRSTKDARTVDEVLKSLLTPKKEG